jgi:hypothetical protein
MRGIDHVLERPARLAHVHRDTKNHSTDRFTVHKQEQRHPEHQHQYQRCRWPSFASPAVLRAESQAPLCEHREYRVFQASCFLAQINTPVHVHRSQCVIQAMHNLPVCSERTCDAQTRHGAL